MINVFRYFTHNGSLTSAEFSETVVFCGQLHRGNPLEYVNEVVQLLLQEIILLKSWRSLLNKNRIRKTILLGNSPTIFSVDYLQTVLAWKRLRMKRLWWDKLRNSWVWHSTIFWTFDTKETPHILWSWIIPHSTLQTRLFYSEYGHTQTISLPGARRWCTFTCDQDLHNLIIVIFKTGCSCNIILITFQH